MPQPNYSGAVGYIGEQFFTIMMSEELDAAHPPANNNFAVQVNGTDVTVAGVTVNSATKSVTVKINTALLAGDIIDFVYTDPTQTNDPNAIQGSDGTDAPSFSSSFIVAMSRPKPSTPSLDNGSDSGYPDDHITNVTTPTVNGTAEAGSTVTLYDTDSTTILGNTTADGSGKWSITSSTLSEGTHRLTAKATDPVGNVSGASDFLEITIDTQAPQVTSITRVDPQATNATSVQYSVIFDSNVTGVDPDDFKLTGTGNASGTIAGFSGSGATYIVTVNTISGDGTLRLDLKNTGTGITDNAGNPAPGFTDGQTYTFDHTAPSVTSVYGPMDGTYRIGQKLEFTVTFNENVTVTGINSALALTIGSTVRSAAFTSMTGNSITYSYTIQAGDNDADGISAGNIELNGSTIRDAVGNDANLDLANYLPPLNNVLVNALAPTVDHTAPAVVSVTSSTANGTYKAGDVISIQVNFGESVTVVGTPQLTLETGNTDRTINYVSGSGTSTLTFNYTVQVGDSTADLDYISTSALGLNGGTIRDAAGNDAILTLAAPGAAGSLGSNKNIVINSAPTIGNLKGDSVAWAGAGNTVKLDAGGNALFSDSEFGALNGGNGNWAGASLTIQRSGTASGTDMLGFDTIGALFTLSGNNLQFNGQTFATFTNAGGVLAITFTSNGTTATTALVNDVAQRITYRNDTPAGDTTIRYSLNDGTSTATADVVVTSNTIYVTNATDTATINLSNGVSFSEAVAIAAADHTGSQTIVFANSLAGQTLNLNTVSIHESLTFDMTQANGLILTGGTITLGGGTTQFFNVGSGYKATLSSVIAGTGALAKAGAGELILSNSNTNAGGTTVSAGTLVVDGSTSNTTIVANGATLAGTGTLGGDVAVRDGGTLSPGGAGVGTLTVNGNLTLNSGSTLALNINGATAGTGYDQVVVNGTVNVSGATLAASHGYTAGSGDTYIVIVNDDADSVTGTFTGISEGDKFNTAVNGTELTTSYIGGTGNDLTLTAPVAPTITTVSSSSANGTYKIDDVITITVEFDSIVNVTGTPTLTLETGAIDRVLSYVSGSGTNTLSFSYTVQEGDTSADLDYVSSSALSLNSGTIQNGANQDAILTLATPGAAGSLGANKALVVDGIRPVATDITLSDTALSVGAAATVTITFSERVTGLDTADFSVANGTLSNLTSSDGGLTWTATFTPGANVSDSTNVITLNNAGVMDLAGNVGSGSIDSVNYAIDTQRPTAVSILVTDTTLKANQSTTVTITFSEAVTGLTLADFSVANGSLSNLSSGDGGITWTATLTPDADLTDATNLITLDNTGYTDVAGNTGTGTTNSNIYAIDTQRPTTVSILVTDTTLKANQSTTVTITFSEAVTGLTTADFSVANGSLSNLSSGDGGITWTATLTPDADLTDATNLITLDNTGYTDVAGNTGTGTSDSNNYAIDSKAPAITSVAVPADDTYTAGDTLDFTVNFDEAVTVDTTGGSPRLSITLDTGGTVYADYLSGSGSTALVFRMIAVNGQEDHTGIAIGTQLQANGATLRDTAGNEILTTLSNVGSTSDVLIDARPPSLDAAASAPAGNATNVAIGSSIVLVFSEAVIANVSQFYLKDVSTDTIVPATISIYGNGTLVIKPTVALAYSTAYYVTWDAGALVDSVGNVAAVGDAATYHFTTLAAPAPAPSPTPTYSVIDGVTVQSQTVTLPGGGIGTQLSIPIIGSRPPGSDGLPGMASIPLASGDGQTLLLAQLPAGYGLTATGGPTIAASNALNALTAAINAQGNGLTGGVASFLGSLPANAPLLIQTLVPIVAAGTTPATPLILTGGTGAQAIVLNTTGMGATPALVLNTVEFAAIIGAATITGGAGAQRVWGDDAAQTIILGAGDDELHGGGGDDVIGSLGGDDRLYGDAGNDVVFGGAGNDTLSGGAGNDRLNGGLGWDTALQSGAQSDYRITQDKGSVILTHTNGEVDRLTSVEVIRFDTGKALYVATSDAQAAFAHIVTTWLGRELTVQEGVLSQQWAGRTPETVADALRSEYFSAELSGKSTEELLAGWQSNAQVLRVQAASEYIAADGVIDSATFADITAQSLRFSVGEDGRWEGIDLRTGTMVSIDAQNAADFSEAYYLASKLAQLRETEPMDARWQESDAQATTMLREAIAAIGMTPEQHFAHFGLQEHTSANPWFDANVYLSNKVQQLNRTQEDGRHDWTAEQVVDAVAANGMTLWTHYQLFGWREDVNPSLHFNATQYFADKLAQLRRDFANEDWTDARMKTAFLNAQLDPISHYVWHGHSEGLEVTTVGVPELMTL